MLRALAVRVEAELLGNAGQHGLLLQQALVVLDQACGVLINMDAMASALKNLVLHGVELPHALGRLGRNLVQSILSYRYGRGGGGGGRYGGGRYSTSRICSSSTHSPYVEDLLRERVETVLHEVAFLGAVFLQDVEVRLYLGVATEFLLDPIVEILDLLVQDTDLLIDHRRD